MRIKAKRNIIWMLALWIALPVTLAAADTVQFAERNPRYRVALSDELEISFRFTPEFNQKVTVQPDG
ncbi:MAG: hypothetical protein GY953_29360, partial [bacterium]|nr:hypothetical protein [bacterium]